MITDLKDEAPGCYELVEETRTFYLAEIFFVRRCIGEEDLVAIAKECLSTMATIRAQYMTTKQPTDPACLPLEPGKLFLCCFRHYLLKFHSIQNN